MDVPSCQNRSSILRVLQLGPVGPVREHALYPMHTPFTPLALGKRASQARNSESGAPAYDVILALEHDRGGCVGISRPSSQKDCGRPVGLRLIGSTVARDSHLCAAQ